jgi:hypothetical protein
MLTKREQLREVRRGIALEVRKNSTNIVDAAYEHRAKVLIEHALRKERIDAACRGRIGGSETYAADFLTRKACRKGSAYESFPPLAMRQSSLTPRGLRRQRSSANFMRDHC